MNLGRHIFNGCNILWRRFNFKGGSILRTRGCMRGSDFSTGQCIISKEVLFYEQDIILKEVAFYELKMV